MWIQNSRQYFKDVRSEFRKVTWPSQNEAVAGTIGVIVVCAIITLVLAGVDMILSQVVQRILP